MKTKRPRTEKQLASDARQREVYAAAMRLQADAPKVAVGAFGLRGLSISPDPSAFLLVYEISGSMDPMVYLSKGGSVEEAKSKMGRPECVTHVMPAGLAVAMQRVMGRAMTEDELVSVIRNHADPL